MKKYLLSLCRYYYRRMYEYIFPHPLTFIDRIEYEIINAYMSKKHPELKLGINIRPLPDNALLLHRNEIRYYIEVNYDIEDYMQLLDELYPSEINTPRINTPDIEYNDIWDD